MEMLVLQDTLRRLADIVDCIMQARCTRQLTQSERLLAGCSLSSCLQRLPEVNHS